MTCVQRSAGGEMSVEAEEEDVWLRGGDSYATQLVR
jgi:hypothetical protein